MKEEQEFKSGEPSKVAAAAPTAGRPRILVVDDEDDIRRLNTEVLRRSGYEVDAAEDGGAAWDALQAKKYDLLITDNRMPKMTGLELLAKIQQASIALPVIVASGTLPELPPTEFLPLQIETILAKPYSLEDLLRIVKSVLCRSADARGGGGLSDNRSSGPQMDGPASA